MSDNSSLRPVQVFLNTKQFIDKPPERMGGGGNRDFYTGDDAGFARHKARSREQLENIATKLTSAGEPVGFLHVQVRDDALAKSHRPVDHLFTTRNGFALVASGKPGELVFQSTPRALKRLSQIIEERAEPTPREVQNKDGEWELRVSGYRSELGAIDKIRLHDRQDRLAFTSDEALTTLNQPNVIGSYIVELFRPDEQTANDQELQVSVSRLVRAFDQIGGGLSVKPLLPERARADAKRAGMALSVRLLQETEQHLIALPPEIEPAARSVRRRADRSVGELAHVPTDLTPSRHVDLLAMLAEQTLVREVHLPLVLSETPSEPQTLGEPADLPPPASGVGYPVVGIIDGGVADLPMLRPWQAGSASLVPEDDRDERHGTFIAGLVAGGSVLNDNLAEYLEPAGCKFYDLDLIPRRELRSTYYADADVFFDQLEESVIAAKRDANVRIFNFSFAGGDPRPGAYTVFAEYFDNLARKHDVIFVISAGNLSTGESRPAWPTNPQQAIQMLAAQGNVQAITPPAEHFLGLTVGALNPPGIAGHGAFLPTTYTRRGPGAGGARKPDLSHIGGVSTTATAANRSGLASLSPEGERYDNCGTSFAGPLVASTLATLDHRLSHQASRELLMGMAVHRATRAPELSKPGVRRIAHEFVGFGAPPRADAMLADDPYGITLVFAENLPPRRILNFPLVWPSSLVTEDGSCRGCVDLTLAYTPPIDRDHGDEALRVELEARLRQEGFDADGEEEWSDQLTQDGAGNSPGMHKQEKYLLRMGLKWSPIKRYHANMRGKGKSANWQLVVQSLARAGASHPPEGIPFAAILTIRDPKRESAIHDEMRNSLIQRGLSLADIQVAHRVRPRGS